MAKKKEKECEHELVLSKQCHFVFCRKCGKRWVEEGVSHHCDWERYLPHWYDGTSDWGWPENFKVLIS